ncbi:hypothetical protein BC629DRAFT_1299979, partial [Irpex lacteus]
PDIRFTVGGVLGIRLIDALNPEFNGLDNGGVLPRLTEHVKKITIRLRWPGYSPWSDVIHVYDRTHSVNPITLRKLAQLLAQKMQAFRDELRDYPYNESSGVDGWQLQHFPIERLVLLELRYVSQGSWQPVLACL